MSSVKTGLPDAVSIDEQSAGSSSTRKGLTNEKSVIRKLEYKIKDTELKLKNSEASLRSVTAPERDPSQTRVTRQLRSRRIEEKCNKHAAVTREAYCARKKRENATPFAKRR